MSAVEQKWSFVAMMIPVIAMSPTIWLFKAQAWDKVIGPMFGYHTRTDPLGGDLSTITMIIFSGLFLHAMAKR